MELATHPRRKRARWRARRRLPCHIFRSIRRWRTQCRHLCRLSAWMSSLGGENARDGARDAACLALGFLQPQSCIWLPASPALLQREDTIGELIQKLSKIDPKRNQIAPKKISKNSSPLPPPALWIRFGCVLDSVWVAFGYVLNVFWISLRILRFSSAYPKAIQNAAKIWNAFGPSY